MKLNRFIAVVFATALILSVGVFGVSAATKPFNAGDVDLDERVTVKDATLIQKSIANALTLDSLQQCLAEVDGDGKITVKDATLIQKKCAKLIDSFNVPDFVWTEVYLKAFYASYNSGKAKVGVPVTFTAQAEGSCTPFTFEFYINGKCVAEKSESNTFTCTFDEVGQYTVTAKVYNSFGYTDEAVMENYEVVKEWESEDLQIKAFYYNNNAKPLTLETENTVFTVEAMFGGESLEYSFYSDGKELKPYSESNSCVIEEFSETGSLTVTVYVRDTVTEITASQSIELEIGEAAPY